jgi:RloB-like protein
MENKVESIQYILIITEDSKSLNIFLDEKIKDLKLNKQVSLDVGVHNSEKAKGTDPTTLISYGLGKVAEMRRKRKVVSHLYCVMDVDDYDNTPKYELRTQAQRLIDATFVKGIPIISNEVSEIWYILHFRNETDRENEVWRKSQQKRNPTILDEQVSEKILVVSLGKKYQKTEKFSKALYKTIKGKEPIAIENARYLQSFQTDKNKIIIENYYYGNPSSQVYILIEHLNELAQIK